eukprot:CAMPEP_0185841876 /NCGR_PEP_ID=MMETSP1353-20130828/18123_1 /TAXON_ID=1077150 /ORGANISM="Erythrolobus australicus, Strain CCMP3124" /LENGTH=190 /DNA_ID=CAMNT_0028541369 /DNA_START=1046 /DNA_END=1614 /DNA_ORIENTATION=+
MQIFDYLTIDSASPTTRSFGSRKLKMFSKAQCQTTTAPLSSALSYIASVAGKLQKLVVVSERIAKAVFVLIRDSIEMPVLDQQTAQKERLSFTLHNTLRIRLSQQPRSDLLRCDTALDSFQPDESIPQSDRGAHVVGKLEVADLFKLLLHVLQPQLRVSRAIVLPASRQVLGDAGAHRAARLWRADHRPA